MAKETKGFMTIKWDDQAQKYLVGHIGVYIDYKGNEFIGTEECFTTNKSYEEIRKTISFEDCEIIDIFIIESEKNS